MNKTIKRACFTLHDYQLGDIKRILAIPNKFVVLGYEVCPTTNKRHIQGFINCSKNYKFNTLKTLIGSTAHIEHAKGTDTENDTYCTKDGSYCKEGTPQGQGKRNDIESAIQTLTETGSLKRVAEEHGSVYVRYHHGIRAYRSLVCPPKQRDFKTTVIICVGAPGTGKSKYANEYTNKNGEAGDSMYYKPRGEWWDGYQQQSTVIIDDFYGWIKYDELLKICDRYPYTVPIKGGFEVFNSKTIIITSNVHICDWYKFTNYNTDALARRISVYYEFNRTVCTNTNIVEYKHVEYTAYKINY